MRAMCSAVRVCVNMCAYVCARACANSFPSHPSTHSCRVVCCVLRAVCCVVSCGTCCVVLCRAVLCRAVMCAMCSEICVRVSVCVYVHPSTHSNIHPSRQGWFGWEGRVVCCVLCAVSCVCVCACACATLFTHLSAHAYTHTSDHPTTRLCIAISLTSSPKHQARSTHAPNMAKSTVYIYVLPLRRPTSVFVCECECMRLIH